MQPPPRFTYSVIYAASFFSGAAALIYEVSWNRQLGLLFGHTSHTAALVLGAYFGGMAIGYGVGGRLACRISPFLGYAICELVAGAWALVVPQLLGTSQSAAVDSWLQHSEPLVQNVARIVFSWLLLAPATIALGAALPMLSEICGLVGDNRGRKLATAYSWNLVGATIGVLSSSTFLLVVVGVTRISSFAALVSLLAASCITYARLKSRRVSQTKVILPLSVPGKARTLRLWYVAAIVSGFSTLALEVIHTRLYSLVFHNSTYSFAVVLVVFLLGLSAGPAVLPLLTSRRSSESLLRFISIASALTVLLSAMTFVFTTKLEYLEAGQGILGYLFQCTLLVLAVSFPSAFLLGMFLPLVWTVLSSDGLGPSGSVGSCTMLNTIAAALGAILASFALIPALGLWHSFVVVAAVLSIPFFVLFLQLRRRFVHWGALALTLAAAFPLCVSDPEEWTESRSHDKLLKRWNSSYGWIDVVEDDRDGALKVRQNLHYRYGTTGSNAEREFRQAHLPLLIHPSPRDVLFLGLGTGMTAAGASPHKDLHSITIVELIPEVVDAARMLKEHNRNIVDDLRTKVVVDDARHYLSTTDSSFSVVIADLFVPWESQTGYLFTVEHYESIQERLEPGGVFCQWLPLYQLGTADFRMIADTLRSVFPHVTLWWGRLDATRPILALIASNEPLRLDANTITARLRSLDDGRGLNDSSLSSFERLLSLYAGDWQRNVASRLNSDEHPWIEFQSPLSHRQKSLLQGVVLRDYMDRTWRSLNSTNLQLGASNEAGLPDRMWQRSVMFPEPPDLGD